MGCTEKSVPFIHLIGNKQVITGGIMNQNLYKLGIDIGSTTVKIAILDENDDLVFSDYERHFANIQDTLAALLEKAYRKEGDMNLAPMITGSGGLTLAKHLGCSFCSGSYLCIHCPAALCTADRCCH